MSSIDKIIIIIKIRKSVFNEGNILDNYNYIVLQHVHVDNTFFTNDIQSQYYRKTKCKFINHLSTGNRYV